jgi:signal transduction histidine kinase
MIHSLVRGTSTRARATSVIAWMLAGVCVSFAVAAGILHVLNHAEHVAITRWWLTNAIAALGIGVPAALIASRRPRNPIGWLLLTVSFGQAVTAFGREYAVVALGMHHGGLPGGVWAAWFGSSGYLLSSLVAVALLLFPTGRVSRRWSPVLVLLLGVTGFVVFVNAVYPGPMLGGPGRLNAANPLGWPAAVSWIGSTTFTTVNYLMSAGIGLSLVALLSRFRGATPILRRQLLVVGLPATLLAAESVWEYWWETNVQFVTAPIAMTLFSLAVAVAILRYGLYEIDLIVNRAIVYALASALLLGAYLATVAAADGVLGHGRVVGSLSGAALVAVLFAPLRGWLQAAVDRALYGERRDPYLVMTRLGHQLPPGGAALPALAETVAHTLKLPYVGIELDGSGPPACFGVARGDLLVVPLVFQGAVLGRMSLGRRGRDEAFSARERQLFDDIAKQVAVVAHAIALTEDLQRSRERLVTTREEERRRIRRDLHDGLGPTLAGIALQLGAARSQLRSNTDVVEDLLGRLVTETQATIADVRRLVDDLRPPALDELGLGSALREQATRFPGLDVQVFAEDQVDGLPAAVEVAAYRIATEAVTNVARHAGASRCTVRLELNGVLELEVTDDGRGMQPGWLPGVGVNSIHERAAELGGTCTVSSPAAGGTVVHARLPVEVA